MCEQHPSANYHHFPAHRCKYFFKPFSLSVTLYKSYFFLQLFINYHHLNYNVEHFDTCSLIIPIPNEQKVTQVKKNKGRTRKENREGLNTVRAKITATRRNTHTHTHCPPFSLAPLDPSRSGIRSNGGYIREKRCLSVDPHD